MMSICNYTVIANIYNKKLVNINKSNTDDSIFSCLYLALLLATEENKVETSFVHETKAK